MQIIGGRAHNLEQIHEVGKLGYPFAEIDLKDPAVIEKEFKELERLKEIYGLYYLAHYPNEGDPSDVERLKDEFIPLMGRLLRLSGRLKIKKGTIHFWIDRRFLPEKVFFAKIELIRIMVEEAGRYDIQICLENLSERYDSFAAAFETIPGLKMTMDIGHGELIARKNTSFNFMKHHFNRIGHIHMHDNLGGKSVKDDLHLPLGEGRVDYKGIISVLKDRGYSSTITMEVEPSKMKSTERIIRNAFLM